MQPIEGSESPNAMVNDRGDYFYPDSIDEALMFIGDYGARIVNAAEFSYFFKNELFALPE